MRALLGIVTAASLAACSPAADVKADGAWVRLPAVAGQPGAAYFTLTGGKADDTLVAVSAPFALKAEMHASMKDGHGMMAMAPLKDVPVPAGAKVAFAPGGRHVMLFSLAPRVKAGDHVPLMLSFASGKTLTANAEVVAPGDAR